MIVLKPLLAATFGTGAAASAAAFEPGPSDTIKVRIADWPSIQVHAEILNVILSIYGYNVEKVVADDSTRYPGFEAGDLHIALETWQTTQQAAFEASLATGKVLDMGELGPQAEEDGGIRST
jgi:glycine betaine/proline transport system substrate-binding protein